MSLPLNILVFFAFYVLSSISGATIDLKHFDDKVIKDSTVWLVEFFSPMCGSCNDFAPTWTKLEKGLFYQVSFVCRSLTNSQFPRDMQPQNLL